MACYGDSFYILRVSGFLDFVHRLELQILENTTFRKLDVSVFR
jgi:hypothetical protein